MPFDETVTSALLRQLNDDLTRPVIAQSGGDWIAAGTLLRTIHAVRRNLSSRSDRPLRVATLLPNDWQAAATVLAGCEVASILPLNPALSPSALAAAVEKSKADAVIALSDDPGAAGLGLPLIDRDDVLLAEPDIGEALPARSDHKPELVLMTSGSTGTPKRVALPPEALLDRAQVIADTLCLTAEDRALHALPMFHIGAFVDLMLAPLISGGSTAITPNRDAHSLWTALRTDRPTWIQLVPTMLQDMVRNRPDDTDASSLRFIRSVSAGLTAELQDEAEALFGCPVIQMYGMTETAGQICSNPWTGGARKRLSVGPPTGIELELRNPTGTQVERGETGEVFVKGRSVIARYDSSAGLGDAWLSTGDLGWQDSDGYLFLTGRAKEQINRGGEKISPLVIERAAQSCAGVDAAIAYAVPHPSLGETVGLAVTLTKAVTEAALLDHLSSHLAPFEMPRRVQILDTLPRLPGGKVDRIALAAQHQQPTEPAHQSEPVRSARAQAVAKFWVKTLRSPDPGPDTDFFEAGGDSLAAITFITGLEQRLGQPVSPNILFDNPTFGALLRALDAPLPASGDSPALRHAKLLASGWPVAPVLPNGLIRQVQAADDRVPFFWCCQSYEEVDCTAAWLKTGGFYALPSLFEMPNRTDADRDALVAHLASEVEKIYPSGPLLLGGYCEGARMMERLAKTLVDRGRVVRALLSVDHKFEAASNYPVQHVISENFRSYPHSELGLSRDHPDGFEALCLDVDHWDVFRHLHRVQDRILPVLKGQRQLPRPGFTPETAEQRTRLYRAGLRARPPWTWQAGVAQNVPVRVTNRSGVPWAPTKDSGLALMAMEVNLRGKVVNRHLGYAGWEDTVAPGESIDVVLPIMLTGVSRATVLHITVTDQGIADFPVWRGGLGLYPRLALIKPAAEG